MEKKYKQVILMYHLESRDKAIFDVMAHCIKDSGLSEDVKVLYMEDVFRYPYDYHPDLIISPFPRDDRSSALFTMLKVAYQCYWIAYSVEAFCKLDEDTIRALVGYNSCPKELIDMYLLCGPNMSVAVKNVLNKYDRINTDTVIDYFGYLYYEKKIINWLNRDFKDSTSIHNDAHMFKKHILVVTGIMKYPRPLSEYLGESTIKKNQLDLIEKYSKRCDANNYYSDRYIEAIYELAKNHPEYMIMVKLHPTEKYYDSHGEESRYKDFENYKNIYVIEDNVQISNYFDVTDVLLHYGSTTSMEAYINGIRSVALNSNHPCMQDDGLGRGVLLGNEIVEVEDVNRIDKLIVSEEKFERNLETEKIIYGLVNYNYGENYSPSKKLVELLNNIEKKPSLNKKNMLVREKLRYKSCKKKYAEYLCDIVGGLVNFDKHRCRRIWGYIKKLV